MKITSFINPITLTFDDEEIKMDIYHKTYALEIAKKYIHNKNHTELIDNLKAEIHKRIETTTSKSKKNKHSIIMYCIITCNHIL